MKKSRIIKAVACLLMLCVILPMTLFGCSGSGKTLMSLGKHKFSVNLYQLLLTQQKGSMAYSINSQYGSYNSEKFWGMTIDKDTQKTNAQYYDELMLEKAKNYLCAMALFDELEATKSDFEFPAQYQENIEAAVKNMIEVDAGGSKTKLNSILSDYGINYKMLKEFLIMDAKATYVVDYLYGTDGSKIGDAVKEQYYNENYVSCKQILFQKYYYVYETDEDGNEIYYSTETGHPIYDTTKIPAKNEDGTSVLDKNGNQIYLNSDGSVAYDTLNGEKQIKVDPMTGEDVIELYSNDKIIKLREQAQKLAAEADGKGINVFESMRVEHSADYDPEDEAGGMMFYDTNIKYSNFTSEYIDELAGELSEMQVGDVKLLESELSLNIVIKTDLDKKAWSEEKYKYYFEDEAYGMFDFIENLKTELYGVRLLQYAKDIEVDTKVLDSIDFSISNVAPNFYYPDPEIAYYLYSE